jgi:hypothetical protein
MPTKERVGSQRSQNQEKARLFARLGLLCDVRMFRIVFMLFALAHDCRPQARTQVVGKFNNFVIAVDLYGSLGGVTNDVTIVAPLEMLFQFCSGAGVDHPVEIIGELF